MLKACFKTTSISSSVAAFVCVLSIIIALAISFFLSTEMHTITSALSLSHQQQMLTERMGLLAHKRLLTYQFGEDPRAVEEALQQAITSYEALLNTNNEYLNLTRMFNKSQPFDNAQFEIMLKQREAWAAYHFTLRHFINDKNLFIKQLHAIEHNEQQQYELTTRLIQSIQAQSEARLTNFTLLRFLILLTTLLSLSWLVFTNIMQFRALRKTSAQHAARVHLLDACLQHANDVIIIAEAGAIDEPLEPSIVYVNEAFTRLTGYSAEEALGKTPRILQGPLSQREELAKIRHALKHWQSVRVEVLNYTKTGELFWSEMDISPIADENGRVIRWISIQRDITERKHQQACFEELELSQKTIQEKQRLSEAKLQQLFDLSPLGIVLLTMTGEFIDVNPAFEAMMGYSKAELAQLNNLHIVPEKHQDYAKVQMLAMYEQGFTKPFEVELIHKDGTHFPVVINSVRIRDVEGKDFHYTLVENITERKRTEQKLLEAKKQAEQLSALKTQFISTISHELRTPMAIIIGYAEIARVREPNLSIAPLLEKIEGAAKNLLSLLNDILDFSKLQAKQDQFEAAEFDLQLLLNNLKNDFSIAAEKKELLFAVEQSSAVPNINVPNTLIGDAEKLKRVFINLIGNALKFTHVGKITLTVRLKQMSSSHALLDFSVRDTGIGIAEKDHDKLFKLFSQVDSSDNRQYEGTGLGLAISDELVHIMGGKISVDSRVGEGSIFSFSLNIELPKTVVNQPNSTLTTPALEHYQRTWQSNKRLLLAEDNEMLQELIIAYLTPIGISVDLARHGKEALAKLAHNDYDLILMDVQMPVMNGIETTEHLRSQARYATLPIIGFTACLTEPEKEQYLASGMTDLIPKPIDTEQFFSTLKKWLGE